MTVGNSIVLAAYPISKDTSNLIFMKFFIIKTNCVFHKKLKIIKTLIKIRKTDQKHESLAYLTCLQSQ